MNANGGIVIEGCLQWPCAIIHRSFPHDLDIVVHNTNYKYHNYHHLGVSCLLLTRHECLWWNSNRKSSSVVVCYHAQTISS